MSEHTNTLSRRAFIGTAAALGAVTMAAPNIAFGATAAEKQAEADAVRNQLVSLQADLEAASDNYYGALDEQQAAQDAMAAEQVKIDDTNAQIQELQGKLLPAHAACIARARQASSTSSWVLRRSTSSRRTGICSRR